MKRCVVLCLGLVLLLSGCSFWGEREYIKVRPHDEGYEVAIDSNAITVSSYLGLKNAILGFLEEGVEEGVLRAESYPGEITEDLDSAIYEIWRGDPLGAYAVDFMTYDCTKIISKYEIHIHTTYRRTPEELESIVYASDMDAAILRITDAMEAYSETLTLRMGEYEEMDIQTVVSEIYHGHPEFVLEMPSVDMTTYPETGTQRILEIQFHYETSQEALKEAREKMQNYLTLVSQLYGSDNSKEFSARRLFNRVRRDGILLNQQEAGASFSDSPYGVLIDGQATSLGYAQTYRMLLESKEISCSLVKCRYMGQVHYICRFVLDDQVFFADPAPTVMLEDMEPFMLTEEELPAYGYEIS